MVHVQEEILNIVKSAKDTELGYILKSDIKAKLLKTPLIKFEKIKYPEDKNSVLDRMLDQALYQLSKNGKIQKKGRGKYSVDFERIKYKPIICKHLKYDEYGAYCPIKKCYIGEPKLQCELLHGTNYSQKTKEVTPMCIGYTDKKPTAVTIKYANMAIARENAKEARRRRYYEANPRDPESKYFLPNLVNKETQK